MDEGVGFDINLNNFGVKGTPSINEIKSIEITPFSYNQLSQLETYNPNAGSLKGKDVLIFAETFENGWQAYEIKNKNWLTASLPFLFGKKIKEHVLVNNWENGWILENTNQKIEFTVIFWPQYLEYLGFVTLIGTLAWLIWKRKS
jgi:hypothetical protein